MMGDGTVAGTGGHPQPAYLLFDSEAAGHYMLDRAVKHDAEPDKAGGAGRRAEFFVFAIIAAFIWPVVAVGVVGGYGFLVWMSQVILGPPGPPGG